MTSDPNKTSLTQVVGQSLLRYFKLLIEDARLTVAEKLTMLLSAIAFYSLLIIMGVVALVFISIGVGQLLSATVAPVWAYTYIAAFYVVIVVLLVVFRKALIEDPVARFLSRMLVEPPVNPVKKSENESEQ